MDTLHLEDLLSQRVDIRRIKVWEDDCGARFDLRHQRKLLIGKAIAERACFQSVAVPRCHYFCSHGVIGDFQRSYDAIQSGTVKFVDELVESFLFSLGGDNGTAGII